MKLYDLRRGDTFTLAEDTKVPPAAPEGVFGEIYEFSHVDGVYANVYDAKGGLLYFAAWTEVTPIEEKE